MSSRGRPRKIGLSEEEIEQQNAIRLALQLKASKEKAAKRKLKNKGYTKITRKRSSPKNRQVSKPVKSAKALGSSVRFPIQIPELSSVLNVNEGNCTYEELKELLPASYTTNFIDNQEECISFVKKLKEDFRVEEETKSVEKKQTQSDDEDDCGWDKAMTEAAYNAAVKAYGCKWNHCQVCSSEIDVKIKCSDCRLVYCADCDKKMHLKFPFCHRSVHYEDPVRWTCTRTLLPTEFINSDQGIIEAQAVPVPLVSAGPCPNCEERGFCGALVVAALSKVHWSSVVTKDGVLHLNTPVYRCNQFQTSCNYSRDAILEDFIASGYYPGNPKNSKHLFSTKLLCMWNHVRLLTPGTSETQFAAAISSTSQDLGLGAIINFPMFRSASKACAYVNHLADTRIKQLKKNECRACVSVKTGKLEPHAGHVDGNLKLCRRHRENQKKGKTWFEDGEMITSQAELKRVKEEVATVRPQGKDTLGSKCGNSEFLAMKEVSTRFKNLDTAGIVMASCPHGCVLDAVDMCEGETFRHTLIPHLKLSKMKCKFLVNDVVCKYWRFAQFLAENLKGEYANLTKEMQGFLSRLHGQCHGWYCQILHFGHWKDGAAGLLGEESEQVFSFHSRYNIVTKVMTEGGRIFFLTLAIYYWNMRKEKILARLLCTRLLTAIHRISFYQNRLQALLSKRGLCEEDLPIIHSALVQRALDYSNSSQAEKDKTKLEKLQGELESLYFEHSNLNDRILTVATSSKWKTHLRSKISKLSSKVKLKIAALNKLKIKEKKIELEKQGLDVDSAEVKIEEVTFDHFTSGTFPWESSNDTSFKEDFHLIDTWMLLKRNREQPKQSLKEMSQFLTSLKSSIENHQKDIQSILTSRLDGGNATDEATVVIKTAEIRRLTKVMQETLRYSKFYNDLDTRKFERLLEDYEAEDDEVFYYVDDEFETDE